MEYGGKGTISYKGNADAGADIIDVGAESTRPGGQPLTAEEEIKRMKIFLPVVLRESSVPVSVDTYHWKTADYAFMRVPYDE